MTTFATLGLADDLLQVLTQEGYTKPTPIQADAIPHLLKGRDLLGIAQTGTGKTAAFALPILQRLAENRTHPMRNQTRALILSPTRELATQIADSFRTYGAAYKFRIAVIFGGVGHKPQQQALYKGLDILVATPGRLIDHMDAGNLDLSHTEVFVLDEADQMLDMGFIQAIRKIVPKLPRRRQSLFFSATMPSEMAALSNSLLTDPVTVTVTPVATTAERIAQQVVFVDQGLKPALLVDLLTKEKPARALIFTRTKHGADRVVRQLGEKGITAAAIHGNKSQNQREIALKAFRAGTTPILIATDIAARGIDVDGVTHVINYDLPNVPESYVHRIGRTARAGADGIAISLCCADEKPFLRDIEKLIRMKIPSTGETREAPTPGGILKQRGASGNGHGRANQQRNEGQRPQGSAKPGGRNTRGGSGGPAKPSRQRDEAPRGQRSEGGRATMDSMGFMQRTRRAG